MKKTQLMLIEFLLNHIQVNNNLKTNSIFYIDFSNFN